MTNSLAMRSVAALLIPMLIVACDTARPDTLDATATPVSLPSSKPTVGATATAALTSQPSRAGAEVVHGWPRRTATGPGLFSWDGYSCAGSSCGVSPAGGIMHNGYGSNDVEIRLMVSPAEPAATEGAVAVSVADEAIYRQLDPLREQWIAEIDGTTISITLNTKPGTSEADLAEAHAIIESFSYEPRNTRLGFRLVFRLTSNDWDSG